MQSLVLGLEIKVLVLVLKKVLITSLHVYEEYWSNTITLHD